MTYTYGYLFSSGGKTVLDTGAKEIPLERCGSIEIWNGTAFVAESTDHIQFPRMSGCRARMIKEESAP